MDEANRRGRVDQAEQAAAKVHSLFEAKRQARLKTLRDLPAAEVDHEVLARYEQAIEELKQQPRAEEEDEYGLAVYPSTPPLEDWLPDVAGRLGQLPEDDPLADASAVEYGYASSNGLMLDMHVSSKRPAPFSGRC